MIERKKKLRIIQLVLLFIALIVIFFTYLNRNTVTEKNNFNNISEKNNDLANLDTEEEFNIFFNIEYSGIDLSGNIYILKSSEAKSKKLNQEIVNMKGVEAVFYFKDGSILNIKSELGIYNNKTLDMKFFDNIVANYNKSTLYANNAEYLNSSGLLKISNNVKIIDAKGNLAADELLFDLKKQTLNVASKNDRYINTTIELNEKKF